MSAFASADRDVHSAIVVFGRELFDVIKNGVLLCTEPVDVRQRRRRHPV